MDRHKYDIIVVSEHENEGIPNIHDELAELMRTKRYAYVKVDADRDWVNWQFVGTLPEGKKFPQDYMDVRDYLFKKGFEMTLAYSGASQFQKA
ncbi:hypothetical protein VCV18_005857 [Metarhizium anisopliae]